MAAFGGRYHRNLLIYRCLLVSLCMILTSFFSDEAKKRTETKCPFEKDNTDKIASYVSYYNKKQRKYIYY